MSRPHLISEVVDFPGDTPAIIFKQLQAVLRTHKQWLPGLFCEARINTALHRQVTTLTT
jgi:hypothetical protein